MKSHRLIAPLVLAALALQLLLGPLEHLAFGIPGMAILAWKRRKRTAHA